MKKYLPVLFASVFLVGCQATFTNLTPQVQTRNETNTYPVEVALNSRQQTLRWNSIRPQIVVGTETFPMRPTPLMTNRWEGVIPIPEGTDMIYYRYRFDYDYNSFGAPQTDTVFSPEYPLQLRGQ